jgi:hypothetical protein
MDRRSATLQIASMRLTRRALLLSAALVPLACERADAAPRTLYVTPNGSGDGSSWRRAASIQALERLIVRAGPAGQVLIAADRGEYRLADALELGEGGGRRGSVRVRGVNSATGEPMRAILRGTRTHEQMGEEAFLLGRGADYLHFSDLDFRDFGNGCIHVSAPLSGLMIEDCGFENIYRFLENTASGADASLRNFVVRRCRGQNVERGFLRIRYASRDGLIEDCAARGRANEGGSIPVGCALDDHAANIVYRRCAMEGFQQWHVGSYWNGDGFSDETDNRNIRYESCEARGSTDAGFDCKSRDVVLENCIAEDNKRNFRLWGQGATLIGCTSRTPHYRGGALLHDSPAHLWIGQDRTHVRANDLTIEDRDGAASIVEFDGSDASLELHGVAIHAPRENWGDGVSVRRDGGVIVAEPE